MLLGLRLKNIGLIDDLDLTFQKGFTVLTGETGAGKSILLDALDALFGGNQSNSASRLLPAGTTNSQIEASFIANPAAQSWLNAEGFEIDEQEVVICREWRLKDDRFTNRCRLNGTVINRHQTTLLRPLLIDITVQGQTQQLGSSSNQLSWLDRLGSVQSQEALEKVKDSWNLWKEASLSLEKAILDSDKLKKESLDLDNLLEELEIAELNDPHEDSELKSEEDRLVNAYKLQQGLTNLFSRLHEGSDEVLSIADHLGVCIQELKMMSKLDSSLGIHLDKAFDLNSNLQELILQLNQYSLLIESDSSRLDQVQQRLEMLKKLQRKYQLNLPMLMQRRDQLRSSKQINDIDSFIQELQFKEKLAREERDRNNLALRRVREEVGLQFEKNLMKYLRPLGLSNVRFQIELKSSQASDNGADQVQFLFSANPGQPLAPLLEVASGGEMSRFLLALKTVLSDVDGASTLLFDEIDAGVSGRVSGAIANVLKELAVTRQVFCITHQPLVAAIADNHFRVYKSVENGNTRSHVLKLVNIQDRQRELAELAGGDFAEARVYAASLLDQQAA